jgi:hypothetical protein
MQAKQVLLPLLVGLIALPAQAQQKSNSTVFITTQPALQGANPAHPAASDPPVRIMGQTTANLTLMTRFQVRNSSANAVVWVQYGWRVAPAEGCMDSSLQPRWDTAEVDVNIPGNGGEVDVKAPPVLSKIGSVAALSEEGRLTKTDVVVVTIGILKVRFEDGSTWSDNEAEQNHIWDQGRLEKDIGCHGTT